MRTVILGGTGFIGSSLARILVSRGDTVVIPSRSAARTQPDWTASATGKLLFDKWDGRDAEQLARVIDGADGVVNLLGENIAARRWTAEQKQRIRDSRLVAGSALTMAFAKAEKRPSVVIQASAVGLYGSWPEMASAPLCTEDYAPGQNFLAATAEQWEASTATIPSDYPDVRRCVIRTAPVLGRNGGMLQQILPLFRYGLGGPVGTGRQPFAWIHLTDEVAAIVFLLDQQNLSGAFNLAAPGSISNSEFSQALGKQLHRPAWLSAPAFMLRLVLGEMADELLLTGQKVQPLRLEQAGFQFAHPEIGGALNNILSL